MKWPEDLDTIENVKLDVELNALEYVGGYLIRKIGLKFYNKDYSKYLVSEGERSEGNFVNAVNIGGIKSNQ